MSIALEKNVVGRVNSGDQFTLSLTADGQLQGTATTSGTENGLQDESVGPLPTRRNIAVTFSESAAGTTDMSKYSSTWACYVDGKTTPFASGSGTSGQIQVPSQGNGDSMICRFINTPLTGKVTITKRVQDVNGQNEAVRSGWTVGASTTATSGTVTSSPTATTQQTDSNGSAVWNLTFGQSSAKATVKVSETQQSGYEFVSGTCVIKHVNGASVTTTLSSESAKALDGVVPGDDVQCTYVNKVSKAKLTLVKKVVNDNGGKQAATAWTLNANGPTPVSGKTGDAAVTNASVNAGDYTLSESGPSGYTASAWSCTGGTLSGAKLTLAAGSSATCTITNDDQAGTLTLKKDVKNTHGGTAVAGDFTLTAKSGSTTISGKSGGAAVTAAAVNAGNYTLSESGPAGYQQQGTWDCGSATVTDGKVIVANGATVTCTVTNVDQPATLTLKKVVDNTNGGSAAPSDFTLNAAGSTNVSGAGNSTDVTGKSVKAGAYTLSESGGPAGYAQQDAWTCDSNVSVSADGKITLANGANVTCTVKNASQTGSTTWTKTDESGHTLKGSEWNLKGPGSSGATVAVTDCVENSADKCTGPDRDPAAGKFNVTGLKWGDYTLTETKAPAGYLMDSTARTITIDGDHLAVNVGPITNAQAPGVHLPLTGGTGSDAFLIGGGVLLAGGAAAGGLLSWRRKHQN